MRDGQLIMTGPQLETLFERWAKSQHILAAVSGGPDSMALLHMLAQWRKQNPIVTLSAATIDHQLRPEAAREAQTVHEFAASLAVSHTILAWQHANPDTKIQERARNARYDLLTGHAQAIGADIIMSAHHADDQAETILFRMTRGSGLTGLAGMAVERPLGTLTLARPLLGLRKHDLVDYCRSQAIAFIDDPSNANQRFARTRMRAILPHLEKHGLGPQEWSRLARRMQRADSALEQRALTVRERLASGDLQDGITLDCRQLIAEPEEIALRTLIACVEAFDPGKPLRLERAESLLYNLQTAIHQQAVHRATLGQAEIRLSAKGILTLKRQGERNRGRKKKA